MAAALLVSACKHRSQTKDVSKIPEVSYTTETVLVGDGNSSQPSFSAEGDRLLFVSAKRPGHVQAQAYEKDLRTGGETRITFQNGDVAHPVYLPKNEFIVYASSTDEQKENPPLLRPPAPAPALPAPFQETSEVYLHSLNGLEITRLSTAPGFDGEPRPSGDGKSIYWTRARAGKLESVSLTRSSGALRVLSKLGVNPAGYAVSGDGKWQAWIDWDESFGVAKLKIQNAKLAPVEILPDLVVPKADLVFSADSQWLFWSQLNTETSTWQVWSYRLDSSCARKISENKDGDRRHPALSPDGQRLVYTASLRPTNIAAGESLRLPYVQSRIMQVGFAPPSGPCAGAP